MLIFDRFPSKAKAVKFAEMVKAKYALDASVHETQESSNAVDIFPFQLDPMIVLVERPELGSVDAEVALEREVASSATAFEGVFAGT